MCLVRPLWDSCFTQYLPESIASTANLHCFGSDDLSCRFQVRLPLRRRAGFPHGDRLRLSITLTYNEVEVRNCFYFHHHWRDLFM